LTALERATRRVRMTSTMPDLVLGTAVEVCPRTARDLLRVEPVGLAVHAAGEPVRPVDLDHLHTRCGEVSGERRSERARALDTDRAEVTVAAHPGQQLAVTVVGGRELPVSQQPALVIDRAGVVGVLVGVDATDHGDIRRRGCHAGLAPPLGL